MKYINNLWWPDTEEHLINRGLKYQEEIRKVAIDICKQKQRLNTAIDIGAHIGIASLHFSDNFKNVISFEPSEESYECLANNVFSLKRGNILAINQALGS